MDVAAIGDHVERRLNAVRISDENEVDELVDDFDDDDEDEEEEEPEPATLGFVEEPQNQWSLQRQFFPSKAGGVPAWLDPVNLPSGKSFLCDICGDPLQFLLQVYATTDKESTFHRTLFVFMCPSMRCLLRDQHEQWIRHPGTPSRSVKVFRSQLPRINSFYSSERPEHADSHKPSGSGAALCSWCGTWKGDKVCSGCKQLLYCSEKHQRLSWRSGHSNVCGATLLDNRQVRSNNVWPEFEIIIEDESEYNTDIPEDKALANSLILRNRNDDEMNLLMDGFQGDDDKRRWVYFQERISKAPEQVLRYYRNTDAKPIWPVSRGRPTRADIPKCSYCGGPRCCEFQILPQLLYFFRVENEPNSLDWASIVVYTCEASCEASVAYKEECAWVQLYPPNTLP